MDRKPTEPMELSELANVDHKMQGHIVRTSGIGRGFQYPPRHLENVINNSIIYDAYLQVPGTNQMVKVQGSHNLHDCAEVGSAYKASSEMNQLLEVIAHIRGINPTLMQVSAVKFGPYMVGDRDSFDRFQENI